ncbi:hypothetical protein P3S68_008198 [Capsicum galapagoense]
MPLKPRASWFFPKCVEAQQLTGHLGVKHCFGAGREICIKPISRNLLTPVGNSSKSRQNALRKDPNFP